MGSNFSSFTLADEADRKVLEAKIAARLERDRHENGTSYSGGIGMKDCILLDSKIFDDADAALEYLQATYDDKWGPGGAVRLRSPARIDPPGKDETMLRKEIEAGAMSPPSRRVAEEILARVRAGKSKTRGCAGCGSSIATSHIRSVHCPVCGADFVSTEADKAKLARLAAELERRQTRLRVLEAARQAASRKKYGETTRWLVGGWCSS